MSDKLIGALCYGIAQGEKCRIANFICVFGAPRQLNDRDANIVRQLAAAESYLATPGEHVQSMQVALAAIVGELDQPDIARPLVRAVEEMAAAEKEGQRLGWYINVARVEMLRLLRALPEDISSPVIRSVAQYGIHIELEVVLNETNKP